MKVAVANVHRAAQGLKEATELFLAALNVLDGTVQEAPLLLGTKKTKSVPPLASFVARKNFRDASVVDGVSIYATSVGFKKNLLGVVETETPGAMLCMRKMKKGAGGEAVHQELGAAREIALGHFWEMLKSRPRSFIVARCHRQFVWAHWRVDRNGWSIGVWPFTSRRFMLEPGDSVITG